mmetsp:Transcript_29590/g.87825  ORF Transcript_29590/g.87825 Transcript_29590/m.87825 type:complete len:259 (-) Transcript_29590:992-1768(-)
MGASSSSSALPLRFAASFRCCFRFSASRIATARLSSSAFIAPLSASSAERLEIAVMRARLSPSRREPSLTRPADSSWRPRAAPDGGPASAASTLRSVATVASLILSSISAEVSMERPVSTAITTRSRRPMPATVPSESADSSRTSSALCATPQTAAPRARSCTAALRSSTVPDAVRSRSAFSARRWGRALASAPSSPLRRARCAAMATRSAQSRAWSACCAAMATAVLTFGSGSCAPSGSSAAASKGPPSFRCFWMLL